MAKTYEDYIQKAKTLVRDKALIMITDKAGDVESAIENAADLLAYYRHDSKSVEIVSTGLRLYALPTDWDPDLSPGSYRIEYPVDDMALQVTYLDPEMSDLYLAPTGYQLRFRTKDSVNDQLPPVGSAFRLHFGIPYVIQPDSVTVPDGLFGAVTKLVARELCLIMSTRFAQQQAGVASGDSANYGDKSDKFLALAKEFMGDFLRKVAPDVKERPGRMVMGTFYADPLHQYQQTLYPRDNSLRDYTDR